MLNFNYKFDDFATLSTDFSKALRLFGTAETFVETLNKWLRFTKSEIQIEVENLFKLQANKKSPDLAKKTKIVDSINSFNDSTNFRQKKSTETKNCETTEDESSSSGKSFKFFKTFFVSKNFKRKNLR